MGKKPEHFIPVLFCDEFCPWNNNRFPTVCSQLVHILGQYPSLAKEDKIFALAYIWLAGIIKKRTLGLGDMPAA